MLVYYSMMHMQLPTFSFLVQCTTNQTGRTRVAAMVIKDKHMVCVGRETISN